MSSVLTVRVPDDMKYQMDALAEATGRTRSWIAAEAIRQYVDSESWQIGEIRKALVEADAGDFVEDEEMERVFNKWSPEGRANAG
ncbi:MAG: CopG family ribbon-helix-helix protein [Pseudomonadota bacterium]|nr:CopG family ribbon-helix-helix protein [Pseudomonadota bacterium]MDP1905607.1 CopG family ribbon-helix-helix protein [Pseudomonadota bacterium]MDP2351636.1 CopG family ribbon-helix-helix protein [Pseudomonadota bacterium]